jgi:hypothetical protein
MLLLKKENSRYFLSGGVQWIPLPEKLKNRNDVDEYYKNQDDFLKVGKKPLKEFSYATDDFKPAKLFEVSWFNGKYPQAKEDETKTLVIDLPAYATDEQIEDYLRQRAKTVFNKEAVIKFIAERPIPPGSD